MDRTIEPFEFVMKWPVAEVFSHPGRQEFRDTSVPARKETSLDAVRIGRTADIRPPAVQSFSDRFCHIGDVVYLIVKRLSGRKRTLPCVAIGHPRAG
jgi:hypothetical protein